MVDKRNMEIRNQARASRRRQPYIAYRKVIYGVNYGTLKKTKNQGQLFDTYTLYILRKKPGSAI